MKSGLILVSQPLTRQRKRFLTGDECFSLSQLCDSICSLFFAFLYKYSKFFCTTIENLTRQELEGIPPTKEQAVAMLEQFWSSDSYASRKKEREDKELAEQMIDTYFAWHSQNENEVIDVDEVCV